MDTYLSTSMQCSQSYIPPEVGVMASAAPPIRKFRIDIEVGDILSVFSTTEHKPGKHSRNHEGGDQGKGYVL